MKIRLTTLLSIILFIACTTVRKATLIEIPYAQERFLILTADDFGASININEGIKIAADKKSITSISALSNFTESLSELKKISESHPDIGIGVHLNIITGKPILSAEQVSSLVNANGNFYTLDELLLKIKYISLDDLRKELRAQILVLEKFDIKLDHLSDQYGILSLYSPFFDIITELAKEYNVPVRTPVIASVKYPEIFPNSQMNKRGRQIALRFALTDPFKAISLLKYSQIQEMEKKTRQLDDLGILHPDILIEYFWGNPTASNFFYIINHLPIGTSEIILHLGTDLRQEKYASGLDLDYFVNREKELITITSDSLKKYFSYLNINTICYSEISNYKNK